LFRELNVQDDSKIDKRLTYSQPATADGEAPHQIRVPDAAQQEKLLQKVTPVYPVSAKRAHLQGTVSLEAVISAEGVPEDITVLSSPSDDLTQSALEAVRQWRYSTTLLNGNPIAVVTNINVNYTLVN
jgi:protein TonB